MADDGVTRLAEMFPALARLGARLRPRHVPPVLQLNDTECGAACLSMVLGFHGKQVATARLREAIGVQRDGADALAVLNAGRAHGLKGRGVKIDVDDFRFLPPASILHWEFNHFVVFDRVTRDGIEIVDPALGRRVVAMAEVRRAFTGVALLFEPTEQFEPGGRGTHHVWRFARTSLVGTGLIGRIVIMSLLVEVLALAGPVVMAAVTDQVLPQADVDLLLVLVAGVVVLLGFQLLAHLVRSHLFVHLRARLSVRMTFGFIEHLTALPLSFFQVRSAGDLMMRLNSHDTIRELLTSTLLSALLDGVLVFAYLAILVVVSPSFAVVVLTLTLGQLAVYLLSRRRQRDLQAEYLQKQAKAQSYEVELFSGIETLKAMGSEQRAVQHWSDLFVDVLNTGLQQERLGATVESLEALLAAANTLLPLLVGTWLVLQGRLSLGSMLALDALAAGFLGPVTKLFQVVLQLELLHVSIERINDVLDAPREQSTPRPAAPRLSGQVALRDVSFRYRPDGPWVVRNVSLTVPAGRFVAVVGRSGAGKTTLAQLLIGLFAPTGGAVLFDGINLADVDLGSVRRQIGIVTQSHELFGATIRDNIALSDPSLPLEDVMRAARLSQVHDEIVAMPLGYNTPLADRGGSLSGGQRQRLALARALVRRPAILLLDEATSALDAATEQQVQHALSQLECTRIVIAHRLSTVINADLIVVMDGGTIAEAGTHAQLLARRGRYAELVAAQTGPTSSSAGQPLLVDPSAATRVFRRW